MDIAEGCIQLVCVDEGMRLLEGIHEENFNLDSNLFTCALKACSNKEALEQGRKVYAHVIYFGFNIDVYMGSNLLDFPRHQLC